MGKKRSNPYIHIVDSHDKRSLHTDRGSPPRIPWINPNPTKREMNTCISISPYINKKVRNPFLVKEKRLETGK